MKEYFLILILLILILLAWSPWQSKEFAEKLVGKERLNRWFD